MTEFAETIDDDAIGVGDVTFMAAEFVVSISDSVDVAEGTGLSFDLGLATDALALADEVNVLVTRAIIEVIAADVVGVLDDVMREALRDDLASDALNLADSLVATTFFSRQLIDTVSVADVVVAAPTIAFLIDDVHALTATRVRITFAAPALINAALTNPASYDFENLSPGSVDVIPLAVILPAGQLTPLFVDIDTSEHTNGASYQVALTPAVRGAAGEIGSTAPAVYVGIGARPTLQVVIATSPVEAQVHFSETIANNAAANDPTNYVWAGGISTVAVRGVSGQIVTLQTTAQVPGQLYTLTVIGLALPGEVPIFVTDAVGVADSLGTELSVPLIFDIVIDDALAMTEVLLSSNREVTIEDAAAVADSIGLTRYVEVSDAVATTDVVLDIVGDLVGLAINESYSAAVNAVGTAAPVTWSIATGALPLGLNVDASTGTISGMIPQGVATGDYVFVLRAVDAIGREIRRRIVLGVAEYVVLLHMNGTAGSTVFRDEAGRTYTASGTAQLVSDGTAFGGISGNFSTDGAYLESPDDAAFTLGANDFTIEAFVTLNATPIAGRFPTVIAQRTGVFSDHAWTLALFDSGDPYFTSNNNANFLISSGQALPVGQRRHVAVSRRNDEVFFHIDGVAGVFIGSFPAISDAAAQVRVAGAADPTPSGFYLNARLDEVRVTKGAARYRRGVSFSVNTSVVESDYALRRPYVADAIETSDSVAVETDSGVMMPAVMGAVRGTAPSRHEVQLSSDGGVTWARTFFDANAGKVIRNGARNPTTGVIILVGDDGLFLRSVDGGASFVSSTPFGSSPNIGACWYGNGIWVVNYFDTAATNPNIRVSSDDGVTWGSPINPDSGTGTGPTGGAPAGASDLFYDGLYAAALGLHVGVGYRGAIWTSPDGLVWTRRTAANNYIGSFYGFRGIAWSAAQGLLVAVGDSDECQTSPDGVNWTKRAFSAVDPFTTTWDVTYSPTLDLWLAVGSGAGGTGRVQTSPDGVNWTSRTPVAALADHYCCSWDATNDLFIASGRNGYAATSPDGVTWTQRAADDSGGGFVASSGSSCYLMIGGGVAQ